jgi:hypothetical protein
MYPSLAGGFSDGNLHHGGPRNAIGLRHCCQEAHAFLGDGHTRFLFHTIIIPQGVV